MPRPVVPIFFSPRRSSRARSSAPCDGRISAALSASRSVSGEIVSPFARIASISAMQRPGIDDDAVADDRQLAGAHDPRRQQAQLVFDIADDERVAGIVRRPESARRHRPAPTASRRSCPCLRRPIGRRRRRRCPCSPPPGRRTHRHAPSFENIAAAEAARLCPPIVGRLERGDGDPALLAQQRGRGRDRRRTGPATRRRGGGLRQGAQDRVGVEREARSPARARPDRRPDSGRRGRVRRPGREPCDPAKNVKLMPVWYSKPRFSTGSTVTLSSGAAAASPSSTAPSRLRSARARAGRSSRSRAASAGRSRPGRREQTGRAAPPAVARRPRRPPRHPCGRARRAAPPPRPPAMP